MTCPRNPEPLAEIVGIEPFLRAHGSERMIVPQALDGNVELAVVLLVDGLHPESGDRPLPADPEDVAMQRHFARFTCWAGYSITLRPPI